MQIDFEGVYREMYSGGRYHNYSKAVVDEKRADTALNFIRSHTDCLYNALDVGCGTGILMRKLKWFGLNVLGVEITDALFTKDLKGLSVVKMNAADLKSHFVDNQFNVVTMCDVIEHMPSEDVAVKVFNDIVDISSDSVFISAGLRHCMPRVLCGKHFDLHQVVKPAIWWETLFKTRLKDLQTIQNRASLHAFGQKIV